MLTITALRNHIANDRPTELHLAAYMDGDLREEFHTGEFVDTVGIPYTYRTGDVLRIVQGYDALAKMTDKTATFELIDAREKTNS